jgi:hypothetical protein
MMYPGAVRNHIQAIAGKNHPTPKSQPEKKFLRTVDWLLNTVVP